MTLRIPLHVVVVLTLCACGSSLSQITADRDDYWAYRHVRTAPSIDARLRAAMRYLSDRPDGRWHREVRRWFNASELAFYESLGTDVAGMRRYLDALPEGPHSDVAADRLAQLERGKEFSRRREATELAGARAIEARLEDAARTRDAFVHAFGDWIRRTASIASWGGRTSELDDEFIYRYRLVAPEAHCDTSHCVKGLSFDYRVPEGTSLVARQALFDVTLELDRGGVVGATVGGPELFTRVGEALMLRPIAPDDVSTRLESLGRVADLVALSVEALLPASRCGRPPTSPVVLERECGTVHFRMIAATSPDEDDRIVVQALSRP